MEHLIANTGIQFITQDVEFDLTSQFMLSHGKPLRYSFLDKVVVDPIFGNQDSFFDFVCPDSHGQQYIQLEELMNVEDSLVRLPNGRLLFDESGLPQVVDTINTTFYSTIPVSSSDVYSINNLESFMVNASKNSLEKVSAFSQLLDRWLPMPMFTREIDGTSSFYPTGWCRLKISLLTSEKTDKNKFRFVWAFDTNLSNDGLSIERPVFHNTDPDFKQYSLCNRADCLLKFMFKEEVGDDGESKRVCSNVAEYIARLLRIDLSYPKPHQFKFVSYYIYLLNVIRLVSKLEVTLHRKADMRTDIPVDLVLDIGNSRTCGVLFDNGKFTSGKMLELRDLTYPWITYDTSFDMRIVFRNVDFGQDIITDDETLFAWKSLLRVGKEAQHLIYSSLEQTGLSQKTTNYSSPKRYLWDNKHFNGKWEYLISKDDPLRVQVSDSIFVPGLTKQFNSDGSLISNGVPSYSTECKYSRSSLMTFVFIEIFQHAMMQINSPSYRKTHGNVDCKRYLRNLIITAPTAMPNVEQMKLRQCAIDGYAALQKVFHVLPNINIVPTPSSIAISNNSNGHNTASWTYDEATAAQLVYLYAEIDQKYGGEVNRFIDAKGHVRKDLSQSGYNKKALTIGSIDIGAGTTDLMICTYKNTGDGFPQLTPVPLFWDSFYLAGDDILKNIILRVIIEGKSAISTNMGSIYSVLETRLLRMSNEELSRLSSVSKTTAFTLLMNDVLQSITSEEREQNIKRYADNLIKGFFGTDAAGMDFKDRQCRADFNVQVSIPIAQMMLELLRLNRPSRVYTFDEIFETNKPASYLLDHFAEHFGFRFEEMEWRYDPIEIAAQVRSTMEPLMKQLSIILHSFDIDSLILAGRPSSLNPITELFIKYYPISPDRLIRLNEYQVGSWYPLANPDGYFYDQKSVVAVGAMVGYLASSQNGFKGMSIDFSELIQKMESTANYIGYYNPERYQVAESFITPKKGYVSCNVASFPTYIGCKQLNAPVYQARPLYALYNNSGKSPLFIQFSRNYLNNREKLLIEEVMDSQGNKVDSSLVELIQQSIADERFWLDDGVFKFL